MNWANVIVYGGGAVMTIFIWYIIVYYIIDKFL